VKCVEVEVFQYMSESNDVAVGVDSEDTSPPHLQLEFKCFLIDHKTNKHVPVS